MPAITDSLFSWDDIEGASDLDRLRLACDYLPDQEIIKALNEHRWRGRDDFPVHAMWRAVIAGVVFQHPSIASLCRELSRNPALLKVCGFNPLPLQGKSQAGLVRDPESGRCVVSYSAPERPHYQVPNDWNFSRFLKELIKLEKERDLVSKMTQSLREHLMDVLPDFGQHLGFDGKAIDSHSTGCKNKETQQTTDPDADWGKHETVGIDGKTGQLWKKVKSWFGYGLHLIADTQYELPVAFEVTKASRSEQRVLPEMLSRLQEETPSLLERAQDFSADRGLDSGKLKARLWDDYHIRPLIDTREMWSDTPTEKGERPTRPLYEERADTIVHTEKGEIKCICPVTQTCRDMAFHGFDEKRGALKYRCPAKTYDTVCEGAAKCAKAGGCPNSDYGRIVRIPLQQHNRRTFIPTPHGSPSWRRGYNRRTALERINNRIDNSFGFEKHFIRGKAKMQTRVGLALAVMLAMALGHATEKRFEYMRSLVKPPPRARAA